MRHNRAKTTNTDLLIQPVIDSNKLSTTLINDSLFYEKFIDDNVQGTTLNLITDTINSVNNVSSTYFNNGYCLNTLPYKELYNFTLSKWIRLENNYSPIVSFTNETNKTLTIII